MLGWPNYAKQGGRYLPRQVGKEAKGSKLKQRDDAIEVYCLSNPSLLSPQVGLSLYTRGGASLCSVVKAMSIRSSFEGNNCTRYPAICPLLRRNNMTGVLSSCYSAFLAMGTNVTFRRGDFGSGAIFSSWNFTLVCR